MVTVRNATEDDLPAMLEIYNEIILNTLAVWHEQAHTLAMRKEWFALKKEQDFPVLVAESQGIILGFATLSTFRPWSGFRFTVENSVYVRPENRGQGVAKLLLPALIDAAKQLNIHAIVAGIEATNDISIALHEKFGFIEVAHFKEVGFKFGKWMDLKFMQLTL